MGGRGGGARWFWRFRRVAVHIKLEPIGARPGEAARPSVTVLCSCRENPFMRTLLAAAFCLAALAVEGPLASWAWAQGSVLPAPAPAAQKPRPAKPAAYTSAEEAGLDYQLQGEYSGLIAGGFRQKRMGVQVVALGDGKFRVVELAGGLPGDGWNGLDRQEFDGQLTGALATYSGPKHYGRILPGMIVLREHGSNTLIGTLTKAARRSSTLGLLPPANAVVLFDGSSTEHFNGAKISDQGYLMEGPTTVAPVGDFQLHLEFKLPFMPTAQGQARANSGVYIQRRYEVQILDSFGLAPQFNDCASLYRQTPPLMNLCLPPLAWQTYDIDFQAARYNEQGKKVKNARITVRHNGVKVHDNYEITGKTGAGQPEGPQPLPILLQNHGDPVRFRNIWIVHRSQPETLPPLVAGTAGAR